MLVRVEGSEAKHSANRLIPNSDKLRDCTQKSRPVKKREEKIKKRRKQTGKKEREEKNEEKKKKNGKGRGECINAQEAQTKRTVQCWHC